MKWYLKLETWNAVFLGLHGGQGEDGTIQALLDLTGVPYTGSGHLASALAMDKDLSKRLLKDAGVPTPSWWMARVEDDEAWRTAAYADAAVAAIGMPLIVKPSKQGSTVGLSLVKSADALGPAIAEAFRYDDEVMIEQFIAGRELTAAILNDEALPLIRIEAPQGNYDYQNKYFGEATKYHCPSGLPAELESKIQQQARSAFRVLGCEGWGRLDLMLDANNQPWFLEMNTIPGMTDHSLVPMAARARGIAFDDLVLKILEMAHVG